MLSFLEQYENNINLSSYFHVYTYHEKQKEINHLYLDMVVLKL